MLNGYKLAAHASVVLLGVSAAMLVGHRKEPDPGAPGSAAGVAIRAEWDGHLWVEYRAVQGERMAATFTHHPDCPCQKPKQ